MVFLCGHFQTLPLPDGEQELDPVTGREGGGCDGIFQALGFRPPGGIAMRSLEDADCGTNTSGCEFGDRSPVAEPCDAGAAEIRQPSAALLRPLQRQAWRLSRKRQPCHQKPVRSCADLLSAQGLSFPLHKMRNLI